jgi:AraC-like DNA-binding protein
MDVHIVPGVKAKNVAEAHQKDLLLQEEYGCKCMTYWIDEARETIFCLVDAPSKEAVEEMHNKAHGLIPNKIIEVKNTLVESFLGRIYDPESIDITGEGLKVFADPSFRILLITKMSDPLLLSHRLGHEKANKLLGSHHQIIRKNLVRHGGREAEQESSDFIISFSSATKALACALDIQQEMQNSHGGELNFKIAIHAGEPVAKSNEFFGDTIQQCTNMCFISKDFRIAITRAVKELIPADFFQSRRKDFFTLSPSEENLLESLFNTLRENWQDPEFDISDYAHTMAMSSSQFYRKTISLTGFSPNLLLKEFRLEKAKELMRKNQFNVAQITFDSGFTSASYFTKCFKKKYGLLPMAYLELAH